MLIADPLHLLQVYLPCKFINNASKIIQRPIFTCLLFYSHQTRMHRFKYWKFLIFYQNKIIAILVPRKNWPCENENPPLDHDDNADFNLLLPRHSIICCCVQASVANLNYLKNRLVILSREISTFSLKNYRSFWFKFHRNQ